MNVLSKSLSVCLVVSVFIPMLSAEQRRRCPGGGVYPVHLPCPSGPPSSGGGDDGSEFYTHLYNFEQLLAQYRQYFPDLDYLSTQAAPMSVAALREQVNVLYWAVIARAKALEKSDLEFESRRDKLREDIRAAEAEIREAERRIAQITPWRDGWRSNLEKAIDDASVQERRLGILADLTDRLLNHEVQAAQASYFWLGAFLSTEQRQTLAKAVRLPRAVVRSAHNEPGETTGPYWPEIGLGTTSATIKQGIPPPNGTTGAMLHELSARSAEISKLATKVAGQKHQLAPIQVDLDRWKARAEERSSARWNLEAEINDLTNKTRSARARAERATAALPTAARNILDAAGGTVVWKWLEERVVIPEIKAALDPYRRFPPLTTEQLRARVDGYWREGLTANLRPDMVRFLQTQEKVLSFARNPLEFASQAADALGRGDMAAMRALAREINDATTEAAVDIIQTATGGPDGRLGRLWTELMKDVTSPRER